MTALVCAKDGGKVTAFQETDGSRGNGRIVGTHYSCEVCGAIDGKLKDPVTGKVF